MGVIKGQYHIRCWYAKLSSSQHAGFARLCRLACPRTSCAKRISPNSTSFYNSRILNKVFCLPCLLPLPRAFFAAKTWKMAFFSKKVAECFGGMEKSPYLCTRKQEGRLLLGDVLMFCRPCGFCPASGRCSLT